MDELVYYMPPSSDSSPGRVASRVWQHLFEARDELDMDLRLISHDPAVGRVHGELLLDPSSARDRVGGAVFYFPISPVFGLTPAFRLLRRLHGLGARLVSDYHGDLREDLHYHGMNRDARLLLYTIPSALMARRVLDWHEMLVLHSRYLETIVRDRYDLRAATSIVPNGIDAEVLETDHHQVDLEGRFTIVYHGRLSHEKGLDILIEAISTLPEGVRGGVHLHMLGRGRREGHLRGLARRLGMERQVHFLGYRPMGEVYATLSSADLLVYPSRFDNFPVSVLEAMGVGSAPVLFSDHMGMNEFAGPALSGNVFALSVSEVRDAVLRVVEGGMDVSTVVREQRAFARRFTWENVVREYVRLFNGMP